MSATTINNAQPGEDLIGIEPPLLQQVDPGWLHRLNLFNGRALTATALQSEQSYRAGRLATLGQSVAQGVVKGLALSVNLSVADPVLQVTPGYGISAAGEDVTLLRTLRTTLSALMVIDPQLGTVIDTLPNYSQNPGNTAYVGVLLLQPITAQMSGASLDTGPVSQIVSGNLGASCDQDPEEYAFADWQIVDGVRLVLAAWPGTMGTPAPVTDLLRRNHLAYSIFNFEMALLQDDCLPWDMLGVPVALAVFDNNWKLQWVDCSSVVRNGGLARAPYVLPATPGLTSTFLQVDPALAQARIAQLAEQLGALNLTGFSFNQAFALLPPCGILPASSMNFPAHMALWFPANFSLTVEPVHQEEIESVLLAGMTAQPLDLTQNESVEILVPLPDSLYDPDILVTETVAQAFYDAVTSAEDELTFVLQDRETVQQEANALSQAINGLQQPPPYDVTAGLTDLETGLLVPALSAGTHSITAVYSGDTNNTAATSAALAQIVSSLLLSSSLNPSPGQANVTLTATISNGAATGNVQFLDGSASLGAAVPLSGGVATLSISSLSAGTHAIAASYAGDAVNPAVVSPVLLQTVAPSGLSATISLTSSLNTAVAGQPVTFKASVSPSSAAGTTPATGNVQFMDGTTALGSAVALNATGVAALTTPLSTAGTHYITASYAGDALNPPANSVLAQTVSQAAASVTLRAAVNPAVVGQSLGFTAVVSPASATGTVQFMDGTTPLGGPVPLNGGSASWPAPETFGTESALSDGYISQDYQKLVTDAGNSPYTIFIDANGNPLASPMPLFNSDDMSGVSQNGIQHFIDRINAKLASANDLLDLAFLTAQSDIYRFRQYVLGASDATALAVSPIAAQIATGESAAVTASNLQSYLSSVLPVNSPSTPTTTTTPAPVPQAASGPSSRTLSPSVVLSSPTRLTPISTGAISTIPTGSLAISSASSTRLTSVSSAALKETAAVSSATFELSAPGTVAEPASTTDILSQSPLVGAQLNLRTLTIAQRMANPPSQEGLFYATGNRVALMQLLADLEITIDDIPILVDSPPPATTTTAPPSVTTKPSPVLPYTVADLRPNANPARYQALINAVLTPNISTPPGVDPDEAACFSAGIHVLEQHSALLRAIEARVQQYTDFLTECSTALTSIQNYLPQAQTLLTQLENDLAQARQDVAFTTALLNDETVRVDNVNQQRAYTLQNYVQAVVYTRPRTLQTAADVPSRQLVPGNVASPVPSCLQQSVAIPPELREIVSVLRDAPVTWMPSVAALLNKLERPNLLQGLAADLQARATAQLTLPLRTSSAASQPGVYAPVIANIFSADQQAVRIYTTQRAAFQPQQLVNLSWASQITVLQGVTSAGDLMSSDSVHAEVVNATSRLMQQISSVATCLYMRGCQALPADRLAWAQFLMGVGLSIQLQSLAVLPNWNTQDYVTRQQTQMLVDWLFQQIDTTVQNAVAFMSDVVRVALLLASDAPVNEVISGAVTLATTPTVGSVVSLTLPSDRIAQGMFVQLYSSGTLTAQAVVTDLDSASVRATVTQLYQTGVTLQANDLAHFTSQAPQAVALRAFDM